LVLGLILGASQFCWAQEEPLAQALGEGELIQQIHQLEQREAQPARLAWLELANPVPAATMISYPFGWRYDPITKQPNFHNGIDLVAPLGSAVHAWSAGRVEQVVSDRYCGLGLRIDGGGWQQLYCHLGSVRVQIHQQVAVGEILGTVGSSGHSTGPHLHWTLQWNPQWNPRNALVMRDYSRDQLVDPNWVLQQMTIHLPQYYQPLTPKKIASKTREPSLQAGGGTAIPSR
jgi:murein DD-endopeptidase MepM/ murein hydrolase activator NlpD